MVPWLSPNTCISTCRGRMMAFSRISSPLPKAEDASARASLMALASSSFVYHTHAAAAAAGSGFYHQGQRDFRSLR